MATTNILSLLSKLALFHSTSVEWRHAVGITPSAKFTNSFNDNKASRIKLVKTGDRFSDGCKTARSSLEFGASGRRIKQNGAFDKEMVVGDEGEKRNFYPITQSAMQVDNANPDHSSSTGIMSPQILTVEKATNIAWHECSVTKEERQKLLGQKGCVIWITGLSGSGKSTLACALIQALHSRGKLTYLLDGDNVRHGLNKNLSFSAEDRAENIRRVGEVAKLFVDAGIICISSFISPYRKDRDACRALLPAGEFIEIFMNFNLQICEKRDAKGLYKLARAGKIKGFTGIDDPYEPPESCEIVMQPINGECPTPKNMAEQVFAYLEEKGFLRV